MRRAKAAVEMSTAVHRARGMISQDGPRTIDYRVGRDGSPLPFGPARMRHSILQGHREDRGRSVCFCLVHRRQGDGVAILDFYEQRSALAEGLASAYRSATNC